MEAALLAVPACTRPGPRVKQRRDGIDWFAGYVVADDGVELQTADIRAAVARRVPEYMVPDVVVTLDRLPLNVNGKLDRWRCPTRSCRRCRVCRPGTGPGIRSCRDLRRRRRNRAHQRDRVAVRRRRKLADRRAGRRAVRRGPRHPGGRARHFRGADGRRARRASAAAHEHRPRLVAGERPAKVPLSAAANLADRAVDPMTPMYNIPLVLRFGEKLDPVVLDKALAAVIERHEVLRTRFVTDEDGQPFQQVLAPGGYALDVDVAQPQPVSADGLSEAIADVVGVGFDLAAAPPLRARLLLDEDGSTSWCSSSTTSSVTVARWRRWPDLVVAYAALAEGHEPAWAPLPVQYADFAVWQQSLLATRPMRRRWPRANSGSGPTRWPGPRTPRPCPPTSRGRRCRPNGPRRSASRSRVKPSLRSTAFARRNDASLFMTLHAISAVVLARMTGERDIVIGTPYAGRGERELDDLVGMFVNTVALRTEIDPARGFADLLSMVREVDLSAPTTPRCRSRWSSTQSIRRAAPPTRRSSRFCWCCRRPKARRLN